MSSSNVKSSILLTDSPKEVKEKVNKYAFSGGKQTAEEQREHGADIDVDVSYQYLRFFLEDDEKLEEIKQKYSKGEMLTGEIKQILIECLNQFLKEWQERRAKVTDEDVKLFMEQRKLDPFPAKWKEELDRRAAEKAKLDAEKKVAKEAAKKA